MVKYIKVEGRLQVNEHALSVTTGIIPALAGNTRPHMVYHGSPPDYACGVCGTDRYPFGTWRSRPMARYAVGSVIGG